MMKLMFACLILVFVSGVHLALSSKGEAWHKEHKDLIKEEIHEADSSEHYYIPFESLHERDRLDRPYIKCKLFDNFNETVNANGGTRCFQRSGIVRPVCFIKINKQYNHVTASCSEESIHDNFCQPQCRIEWSAVRDDFGDGIVDMGSCCCTTPMCNENVAEVYEEELKKVGEESSGGSGAYSKFHANPLYKHHEYQIPN